MKYNEIKSNGLQGLDVSKEVTLREYGYAWHELPRKGVYRIYIGDPYSLRADDYGDNYYNDWEVLEISCDTDVLKEYGFVKIEEVLSSVGMTLADWKEMPLPAQLSDLIQYYGSENF